MYSDISALNIAKSTDTKDDTTSNLRSNFVVSQSTGDNSTSSNTNVNNTGYSSETPVEEYNDVPEGYVEYVAKDGETLADIAKANGMTVEDLKSKNPDLMNDNISEGVRLFIPDANAIIDDGATKNIEDNSSNNTSTNNTAPSSSKSYAATNDLRNLNLGDYSSMKNSFVSKVQGAFSKFRDLIASFTKVHNFANEKGYDLSKEQDVDAAIDSIIKDNSEYSDVDRDKLKKMILKDEEDTNENNYDIIMNNLLLKLGYKESEIEEFSTLDILDIIKDNRSTIDEYLSKVVSSDYDFDQLLSLYVIDHYNGLIPTSEDFDTNDVLSNYQEEAIDLLSKLGMDLEELNDMNVYELVNKLVENKDKLNELLNGYGMDLFSSENGFDKLFTNMMANISYQAATKDRGMLADYIDANGYSEDTKTKCLDYFDDGNVKSALYTLRLEDLYKEEENNNNRIEELDKELQSMVINDPSYLDKSAMGYSYDDILNMMGEENSDIKTLLDERKEIKARNNEMGNERYQIKMAIQNNTFQYLDSLRDSDEYKEGLNKSKGVISYNQDVVNDWLNRLNSGNIIYGDQDGIIANNVNVTNELMALTNILENTYSESEGDTELFKQLLSNSFLLIDNKVDLNNIENIEQDGDTYTVRVKRNYDKGYVTIRYNSSDNTYQYDFEEDGKVILSTSNPADYSTVNYFELFRQIESREEFQGMTREEIFAKVFDWTETDMNQYNDSFAVAEMCYMHLEDSEIDDYIYLYNVEGPEAANRYLETKRDSIHQEIGMKAALNDVEYIMNGNKTFRTGVVGLENGVQGWGDNVYTFFSKDTTMTPTEYESEYLLSLFASYAKPIDLNDQEIDEEILKKIEDPKNATYLDYAYAKGDITEEQYNNLKNNEDYKEMAEYVKAHPEKIKYSYMIGQNVGNMLPSVLGSLLVSPLGGVTVAGHFVGAGQATAGMLMYAGAYGSAYKEAIRSDHDEGKANLYASLNALSEVATEYFLGRIPGVGRISESVNPVIYQNIGQLLGMRAINLIKDVGGELLEESLQIWIDYALKKGILGEEIDLSGWPDEQKETMVVTTFTTLILGLPSNIASLTTDMTNGPLLKLSDDVEIKLSFEDVMRLNKECVNSETGKVDIEKLKSEIAKLENKETTTNEDTTTVSETSTKSIEEQFEEKLNNLLDFAKNSPDTEENSLKLAQMLTDYYKFCNEHDIDSYKASKGRLFNELENASYIIESTPIMYDLDEKKVSESWNHLMNVLENGGGISEEEANLILEWSVEKAREVLNRDTDISVDSLMGACGYSQMLTLLAFTKAGLKTTINNASYFNDCGARHAFGTVTIPIETNGKVENKQFLIDATYRQFFTTARCNEGRYYASSEVSKVGPEAGYYMLNYLDGKDVAKEILEKGYIELTPEVLQKYAEAFILDGQKSNDENVINSIINSTNYQELLDVLENNQEEFDYDQEDLDDAFKDVKFPEYENSESSNIDEYSLEEKQKMIKELPFGNSVEFYTDEDGKGTILIDSSILDNNNLEDIVNQLHSIIPDQDIWCGSIDDVNRIKNSRNQIGNVPGSNISDSDSILIKDTSAFRKTGMDQIEDIENCGYVRIKKNARHRGRLVNWGYGRNKNVKTGDGRAIIEVSLDKIENGQVGAVSLDDITAIWVYSEEEGKYVNIIQEVREAYNEKHPNSNGDAVLSQYGTILYNAKYDVINYLEVEGEVPPTGNNAIDQLLNQDIMSKIQTLEESNTSTLYNAEEMPLSNNEVLRRAQEKTLNGEELTFAEKLKLGRDKTYKEIDGVEFQSDHAYRAVSEELFDLYQEKGEIQGVSKDDEYQEYEEDGKIYNNNRGVDWYLGGACLKYGSIILECPASTDYFQPAFDNGSGMSSDPTVRHMKSSGYANPVPLENVTRAFRVTKDENGNLKMQELDINKSNSPTKTSKNEIVDSYVQSYKEARDMILNKGIIGYDQKVGTSTYVNGLNNIFEDSTPIGQEIHDSLLRNGFDLNKVKEEISYMFKQDEIDNFFNNTYTGKFLNMLTADEMQALKDYSGFQYDMINEYMRTKNKSLEDVDGKVNLIKSLMNKYNSLGVSAPLLLYRGDSKSFAKCSPELSALLANVGKYDNQGIYNALQNAIGKSFTTDNFFSTSPAYNGSFAVRTTKNVIFEIIAPPGTKGAYVNSMSELYNSENEFLLDSGTDMKILDVYMGDDGKAHVITIVENTDSSNVQDDGKHYSIDLSTNDTSDIHIDDIPSNDGPKPMSELTLDMLDRIDDALASDSTSDSAAYNELLNIINEYNDNNESIPSDDIVDLINHCQELRESIVSSAKVEVSNMLSNMYGVNDQNIVNEIVNNLTGGEEFIDGKVGTNIDWDKFVTNMEDMIKNKINQEIQNGKEPVLWSGFADKYHESMNDKYTTTKGTTVGNNLKFLDALYPNWNKEGSPKLENLWSSLSSVYTDGILKATNPSTGTYYDNIKFLYPDTNNKDDCFGELFKTTEFPSILKSGTVKSITLSKVNPDTMEVLDNTNVDISDISDYYIKNLSGNNSNTALDQEVFNMLINKINS